MSDEYVNYQSAGYSKRMVQREMMSSNMMVQGMQKAKFSEQKKISSTKKFTKEEEEMIEILFDSVKTKDPKTIYSILKGKEKIKKTKRVLQTVHFQTKKIRKETTRFIMQLKEKKHLKS